MKKILIIFLLMPFLVNAKIQGYSADMHRYDLDSFKTIDKTKKVGLVNVEYKEVCITREDGSDNCKTREYILSAIESCEAVADYENTTRYFFWVKMLAKADELGI